MTLVLICCHSVPKGAVAQWMQAHVHHSYIQTDVLMAWWKATFRQQQPPWAYIPKPSILILTPCSYSTYLKYLQLSSTDAHTIEITSRLALAAFLDSVSLRPNRNMHCLEGTKGCFQRLFFETQLMRLLHQIGHEWQLPGRGEASTAYKWQKRFMVSPRWYSEDQKPWFNFKFHSEYATVLQLS